jgi:hypothetical protein
LPDVAGSVSRHTSVASPHSVISKNAPANVTQSRRDFSEKSQASLMLQ